MLPLLSHATQTRFPIPDWDMVRSQLDPDALSHSEQNTAWTELGREWMHLLRDALGEGYKIYESRNFWLLSDQGERTGRQLIAWAEAGHTKLSALLDVNTTEVFVGKCPVIVITDIADYDTYCLHYISEDAIAPSGGVFITQGGFGHFIFPFENITRAEPVLVHELAHSLLSNLPLPRWLNEGVAQLCEKVISGVDQTDYQRIKETIDGYWTVETIQEFWSGDGFQRNDHGQLLNYHLAAVIVRDLAGDRGNFLPFLREADFADAGNEALLKHFDVTLAELASGYLGDGDWTPDSIEALPH